MSPSGLLIREVLRTQCEGGVQATSPSQHAIAQNSRWKCNSNRGFVFDSRQRVRKDRQELGAAWKASEHWPHGPQNADVQGR